MAGGAPWWASGAEHLVLSLIRKLDGGTATSIVPGTMQVSPWFVAGTGVLFCLLSMRGFHMLQKPHPDIEDASGFEAGKLASAADIETLLDDALSIVTKATGTDYNQIFLVSTERHSKHLVCVARHVAPGKQDYRIAAFDGLLGKAIESGRVVNVPDVTKRTGYMNAVVETRSELVVPITIEGKVVGVINSESERYRHFSPERQATVLKTARALGNNLHRVGWSESLKREHLPWLRYLELEQI